MTTESATVESTGGVYCAVVRWQSQRERYEAQCLPFFPGLVGVGATVEEAVADLATDIETLLDIREASVRSGEC